MTNITFVLYFLVVPIIIGAVISRFIVLDNPEIKPFKVNMPVNWTVFAVIAIGIGYVTWHETRTILDDWVTLGGLLGCATINLSLGFCLQWREKNLKGSNK